MAKMAAAPGHFLIPTAPAVGTTCAQSASANTFGTLTQLIASTSSALFITGIYIQGVPTTNIPTYVAYELAVVASTIIDMGVVNFGPTTGVAGTAMGVYKPIYPPVPVATATKILGATASSVASALAWTIILECVAQSNVVDDTIAETMNIAAAQTVATVTNLTNAPTNGDLTAAMKTSINASTIATVTNLTNAPTVGDFTATMKTSLQSNTGAGKTTFNE